MLASWPVIVGCPQVIPVPNTKRFLVIFLLLNVTDRRQRYTARFTSLLVQFWPFLTSFISSPPIAFFRLRIILLTFFSFGVPW